MHRINNKHDNYDYNEEIERATVEEKVVIHPPRPYMRLEGYGQSDEEEEEEEEQEEVERVGYTPPPRVEDPPDESLESIIKNSSASQIFDKVMDFIKESKNCKLEERQFLEILGKIPNNEDQKRFLKEAKDVLRRKPDGDCLYLMMDKLRNEGDRIEMLKLYLPMLDIKGMAQSKKMKVVGCFSSSDAKAKAKDLLDAESIAILIKSTNGSDGDKVEDLMDFIKRKKLQMKEDEVVKFLKHLSSGQARMDFMQGIKGKISGRIGRDFVVKCLTSVGNDDQRWQILTMLHPIMNVSSDNDKKFIADRFSGGDKVKKAKELLRVK